MDRTDYIDASTEWACTRKKAYADPKLAKTVARSMNERNSSGGARPGFEGVVVAAYACTRCGAFHIGRVSA